MLYHASIAAAGPATALSLPIMRIAVLESQDSGEDAGLCIIIILSTRISVVFFSTRYLNGLFDV